LELDTRGLDARDAALAEAIYDAAVRRWLTLSAVLEHVLGRPMEMIEPPLRAVLLAGSAQLLLLDRIPDHAAVDESVELAKAMVREKAGGLANAALRKIAGMRDRTSDAPAPAGELLARDRIPLSDGRVVVLKEPVLPAAEVDLLAASTSTPVWLLRRWASRWPADRVREMALHGLVRAPIVLHTGLATSPLPSGLIPHSAPGHHVFTGTHSELVSLLASRRDLWVQDAASSRAVASASSLRPSLIIDLCAGQGTKTRQLAATFPDARIVATDVDPGRLRTLQASFEGSEQVRIVPSTGLMPGMARSADLILLDVPCSNTGVLARRVEARYRCGAAQLQRLAGIQRQIIADSIPLLRTSPRGKILYSTCSLETEENRDQAAWAVRWHRFKIQQEEQTLPTGIASAPATAYRDGAYSALLG
jgi:16S rRNA (cytosine967-C5)-methyltransferase